MSALQESQDKTWIFHPLYISTGILATVELMWFCCMEKEGQDSETLHKVSEPHARSVTKYTGGFGKTRIYNYINPLTPYLYGRSTDPCLLKNGNSGDTRGLSQPWDSRSCYKMLVQSAMESQSNPSFESAHWSYVLRLEFGFEPGSKSNHQPFCTAFFFFWLWLTWRVITWSVGNIAACLSLKHFVWAHHHHA